MKNEKNYVGFCIPKIWQILKPFAGTFDQALTSYFWRVCRNRSQEVIEFSEPFQVPSNFWKSAIALNYNRAHVRGGAMGAVAPLSFEDLIGVFTEFRK